MLSKNAIYLLNERYCLPGETPEGVFKRTAEAIAQGDKKFEDKIYNYMTNGVFLPNSPCLFNAPHGNLHACYTLDIQDDITSIFKTVSNMAYIFKPGGGVGINFTPLREKNSPISNGGTSSGVLSFMEVFDKVVDTVKQGGKRRGALMGILNYDHPDIFDFIKVKLTGKLQNFNLSIMVKDEFMKLATDTVSRNGEIGLISPKSGIQGFVKARDIFDLICFASWCNGDPALLFFDRINQDNPFYPNVKIDVCNPCSEVALPPYSACCLGSINLSKFVIKGEFDFEWFFNTCQLAMRFLTTMNNISVYPLPEVKERMEEYNPVGVGIMGFADCLIKLSIKYDSDECLEFIKQLGSVYKEATESYDDKFHFYRRIIAPTGSLSILADCSSGIEPIFDTTFTRSLTIGRIEEVRDLYKSEYVRTAHDVSPEWHVRILSEWQKWVDGGVSKTVNLPHDASIDDVKLVYTQAWLTGCKGITVYRDGSRNQVLESNNKPKYKTGKCSDETCTL
jgi:ribonucleoside-diphosphate reductase alpha chain